MKSKKILFIIVFIIFIIILLRVIIEVIDAIDSEKVVRKVKNSIPAVIGISENLSPRIKFCDSVVKPENIVTNNKYWQTVVEKNIYLYSAHYDNRFQLNNISYHFVRVIATVRNEFSAKKLHCLLWSNYSVNPLIVFVISQELWVDFWPKDLTQTLHKSYIFSCPVPQDYKLKVMAISITDGECLQPINYLKISNNFIEQNKRKEFAVCVKGMDFQKDISIRLIEWIELQLLLGSDLISFYVYSIDRKTQKVLNYYKKIGKVKTKFVSLPADLPNSPQIRSEYLSDNIWQKRRLELIAYNDCLYQHLYSHRFVVLLDLDEAIVPRLHLNWNQMIDYIISLEPKALRLYTSFAAQNVYFFGSLNRKFDQKTSHKEIQTDFVITKHIYRSANFSRPGFAVKSFTSTDNCLAVFNHYSLFPLYSNISRYSLISKSLAQLNHYREDCPKTMFIECVDNFMKYWQKDTIALKYKNHLTNRIKDALANI